MHGAAYFRNFTVITPTAIGEVRLRTIKKKFKTISLLLYLHLLMCGLMSDV